MRRRPRHAALVLLVCAAASTLAQERRAPPLPAVGPGGEVPWPEEVVATLRTFFERFDIDEVMAGLRSPDPPGDPAALLGQEWLAPFRWVQQAVAFEPYHGVLRGPEGTAMARGGNALDRALLLSELYRQRGVETRLVRGTLRWGDAERLARLPGAGGMEPGDPFLRLVESTSDHWWIEARRDGSWVALDSSFPGQPPGDARGSRREAMSPDRLPATLQGHVRVEVLQGGRSLVRLERQARELSGLGVRLTALTLAQLPTDPVSAIEEAVLTGDPESGSADAADVDPVALALPAFPDDAVTLRLQLPDGTHDLDPMPWSQLHQVVLRVRTVAPLGLDTEVAVPWGTGAANVLSVRIEPGRAGADRLAAATRPVYLALRDLSAAEMAARQAFLERPHDATSDDLALQPPIAVPETETLEQPTPAEGMEPWTALHVAVIRAWSELAGAVVEATSMAALAATDTMAPPVGEARPGLRLLGTHWQPPTTTAPGAMTLWLDDPRMVGGGAPARRELQTAYGLLSSAMLGQVLNRVADRSPLGAFDVTLRAVGAGSRLSWWRGRGPEAPPWPPAGVAAARDDLRRGRHVVGPAAPLSIGPAVLLGWWAWDQASGTIDGRVLGDLGTAQASVAFADPVNLADFDSALASTAALHLAARWLVAAADSERTELRELLPRACAATALVRDLLLAGAPEGWREPRFADFCGAG